MNYNLEEVRKAFPILATEMNGRPLVYFDNAATTQKPRQVLEAIVEAYSTCNANVHRGVYKMSRIATERHESARDRLARFLGAEREEVVFTRGATESLNTIAYTYGETNLCEGDNVVVTIMEHHSNFVPWQQLAKRKGATFSVVSILPDGSLDMEAFQNALTPRTKLVAFCHVSNVLGTVNPVAEMVAAAHRVGAIAIVDGAQSVAHMPVDVKELDVDFYAFSSHKMYGPTGIGLLYGKRELLEAMPPLFFGGEMIDEVTVERTSFAPLPYKFEAGTPDFVGSIAFAAAADYIETLGMTAICAHEQDLLHYATTRLTEVEGLRLVGTAAHKDAVLSFVPERVHAYDLGLFLDQQGFALRSGHHCAEPLMQSLGLTTTLRASFALYNTREEVDAFIAAMEKSMAMLS